MPIRNIAKKITHQPERFVKSQLTRKMMNKLADDLGMVYFGYVSQKHDDHRVVRGFTLSPSQRDHHYSLGSYKGRDMIFLQRDDTVGTGKHKQRLHWNIVVIDLKGVQNLPHMYIAHRQFIPSFKARQIATIMPIQAEHLGYGQLFNATYQIYAKPTEAGFAPMLLPPNFAEVMAGHFQEMSVELVGNSIYIYNEKQHPSRALFERMISNGIWLAELIEQRVRG